MSYGGNEDCTNQIDDDDDGVVDCDDGDCSEFIDCQGSPVDVGGYFRPDPIKAASAMRPSATLNAIIDSM